MTAPLRAFLMLRSADGSWEVSVYRDLDSTVSAWSSRSSLATSGVLHVGFSRPPSQLFDSLAASNEGKMLLTGAARYALPEGFLASRRPLSYVDDIPIFLGLRGWGYLQADDNSEPVAVLSTQAEPVGWVRTYLERHSEDNKVLTAAGIWDDESYLSLESSLPRDVRHRLGLERFKKAQLATSEDPNEYLAGAPPWLLDLPFTKINLTVRVSNAFVAQGMTHVRDLLKFSSFNLLHIQNFGRKSLGDLRDALSDALTAGPPEEAGFNPNGEKLLTGIERSLGELEERERDILVRRMGYRHKSQTLQEIGDAYGVTRERIRQLENKALQKLARTASWIRPLVKKLDLMVIGRDFPLPIVGLEALDDWFEGIDKYCDAVKYILATLCDDVFHVVQINEIEFVGRESQEEWGEHNREAKKLLSAGIEASWSETHCRSVVDAVLDERRQEFRSLLWQNASRLCNFSDDGGLGRTLVAYGRGAEQAVEAILYESTEPLHYTEIARRVNERTNKEIDVRRVHNAAATVGILLGRGTFGIPRHVQIDDQVKRALLDELEQVILEGPDDRQWHSAELLTFAAERLPNVSAGLSKYVIDYILSSSPVLTRLGRMVWSKAASSLASRIDVRQAVTSLLIRAGQPLSTTEIRQKLIAQRGLSNNFQVVSTESIVRLGHGLWGLNDRDLAVKKGEQPALIEKVVEELCRRGVGIHYSEVKGLLGGKVLGAERENAESIFSLCSLDGRMQMSSSGYLYLKEWKEPRRATVSAAIQHAFSGVKRLSIDSIISAVEAETRRSVENDELVLLLQANNATRSDADSSWSLQHSDDDKDVEIKSPSRNLLAPIDWTAG